MTMYDLNSQRTVFEKMTNKHLPEEPYPTMYLDGYSPEEIIETAHNSIMREHFRRREAAKSQEEDEPMNVKLNVEVKKK